MVIELAGDQEQFVLSEAARRGVTPDAYVKGLVTDHELYLAEYVRAVERGIADAEAGRVEEHEAFFERWYRERPDGPANPSK